NVTNGTVNVDLSNAGLGTAFATQSRLGAARHLVAVPLVVNSTTTGIVNLQNINLTYNPNPVYLNATEIMRYLENLTATNYTNLTITAVARNGTVVLSDLRYGYAGGKQYINITFHNPSYSSN